MTTKASIGHQLCRETLVSQTDAVNLTGLDADGREDKLSAIDICGPSLLSFSSFNFPGAPYRMFFLLLPCLFYLVVIDQQQHRTGFSSCFFPGFLAIFNMLSSNKNNMFVCHATDRAPSFCPTPFRPRCFRPVLIIRLG